MILLHLRQWQRIPILCSRRTCPWGPGKDQREGGKAPPFQVYQVCLHVNCSCMTVCICMCMRMHVCFVRGILKEIQGVDLPRALARTHVSVFTRWSNHTENICINDTNMGKQTQEWQAVSEACYQLIQPVGKKAVGPKVPQEDDPSFPVCQRSQSSLTSS